MTDPQNDMRRAERFSYSQEVTFTLLGEIPEPPPTTTLTGSTVNVSEGGLSVRIEGQSPKKGAIVSLRLPLSNVNVSIPILSEVRWVREILPRTYHVGLMFLT